jgi:hypothetical protein
MEVGFFGWIRSCSPQADDLTLQLIEIPQELTQPISNLLGQPLDTSAAGVFPDIGNRRLERTDHVRQKDITE